MKDCVRGLMLTALTFGMSVVLSGMGTAEVFLNLESPAESQEVSGIGVISGWAFSSEGDGRVTVSFRIDDIEGGEIACCVERADVAAAYPQQPRAFRSGFGGVVNFNLLPDGVHTITVEAKDSVGNTAEVRSRAFSTSRPGGFEFLSILDLSVADTEVEWDESHQSFVIKGVVVQDKATEANQTVNIRMAWQSNTQTLGIVQSQNVGDPSGGTESGGDGGGGGGTSNGTGGGGPAISLVVENPAADVLSTTTPTLGGIGVVSGWVFSRTPGAQVNTVRLRVNGNAVGDIPCCTERADVQAAYPDFFGALRSGFGALFNFNLLESGVHLFAVEVQDSAGAIEKVEKTVTTAKLGDSEFLDEFDLANATASIEGDFLVLEKVRVRDKATQRVSEVTADYVWVDSCQCFVVQQGCGNGTAESSEECDGVDLEGESCSSFGFTGGALSCRPLCSPDDRDCLQPCLFELRGCEGPLSVYVTNVGSNTVSVIDAATNEVRATVRVGKSPRGVAVSPDGRVVYVANFDDNTVSVINAETNSVTATILVGKGPLGIAVSPNGERVYVVNGFDGTVSVIAQASMSVEQTIAVGREPQAIVLTPDGQQGYVTNFADDSVSVLNLMANTVSTEVFVGKGPNGIALSPTEDRVYVVNFSGDSVSIIDRKDLRVIETLSVGLSPAKVVFSPDGKLAYVSNSLGLSVSVIDTATLRISDTLNLAASPTTERPDGIGVMPGGQRLYVALFGNGLGSRVQVLSTLTSAILGDIEVGAGPFAVAVRGAR